MAFNISQQIDIRSKCANIDVLYGPYNSIEEACSVIIPTRRVVGRTVGIINNGSITEYWWKSGIEDSDLVQKNEQLTLSLHLVGDSVLTKEEGEIIYGRFIVDGGAGIKRAVLYQVINGNEVFIQEYGNIGKGSSYTFTIPNPTMSGVYTYHIKVIDTLDNYAITGENLNYIEYVLNYGGISTVYNLTQLNSITVKNYSSVAGQPFQLNISVRDNSFYISRVCLTDVTDETSKGLNVPLTPYINSTTESNTYLGNNYYYLPDSDVLENFNGQQCSVVIYYTENGNSLEKVQNLFKLLDISTLEIIPEYEGGIFYGTLPSYYTFKLQSGVENLSIILTPGDNSDFTFERTTVLAYRRFSLRVIPNDIVKSNAQIVINYRYTYNNDEYSGKFTRIIGNILELPVQAYYEPEDGLSTSMITLIDANSNDYTDIDDGQYYKVINDEVSTEQLSSSFLFDIYCKINQQNDKSIKYITITYGGVEVASITEDEISCVNQWRNLYTDTPINEWTQIGIGINLKESISRNNEEIEGWYHSIYINGMVVKTVLIDKITTMQLKYNSNSRLKVTVGNGILVQKCFLYYRNDGEEYISPNTPQHVPIIYNNFKSHKRDFEEPQDLPVLKFLRISNTEESERYFNLINAYKDVNGGDKIVHLTQFGIIGSTKATDMAGYDPNYTSSTIESNATLFRQSVDIKKPAQKEYAVLCHVQWMGKIMEDVIVEVHTQGTSTLVYSIPNFKFTFWRLVGNTVEKYFPQFIQIEGKDEYYEESVYTAKADFMDSSHLNNTPTCNYYNDLIKNLISSKIITGSPSARNGMLDAIMGFPIVMEISDTADDFDDIFINIGSFMLNIDKTGNSLGFEVEEDGVKLSCISFEGTSNDNDNGAAGRFDIPDGMEMEAYTNSIGEIDTVKIDVDYNFVKNNILKKKGPNDSIDLNGETILVKNHPYVKWCNFLSDGLEYRYPDADIYSEKNGAVNKVMSNSDFTKLYKMWWWVYKSDTLTQSQYKEEFVEHFDLHYCMIYFINLMIYAQTDNLGKNAMFDSWDGEHWYPRPYDLDSEAGLDNNGNDNIAPFVEIRPTFSLNYNIEKANDYSWLAENYLLDEDIIDDNTQEVLYPASTIKYGSQTYDRYHFSSNKSKLWINFYKNFKDEINSFYVNLRNNCGYTPETIIGLCKSVLIDKLGTAQYNQDFQNKYLANSDQRLAYGNRWYKFKKWITKRFAFCDSYFGASETAMYNITSRINYNIKVDAPQYIAQQYQGASNRDTRFVLDNVSFSAGSGAATIITLLVNQPSVFETSLFKNVVLNQGSTNYTNLITLDVSGNKNPLFTSITSVTGENLNNLKYLNISNSAVQNLEIPINVKTLIAENVNLSSFIIPDGCAVESISLKGSTFLGDVDFSMLPNLKKLDLTECVFNQNVTFANLPKLEELTMSKAIFDGVVTISDGVNVTSFDFSDLNIKSISFSGSNLQIDTINFHNTKFGVDTLNLNAICKNIKDLYFDNCTGLTYLQITDGGKFENLYCLSLYNSSINALGSNNSIFDCQHFNNISGLKCVNTFNSNGTIGYRQFTFWNTVIKQITNINWSGTGVNLFRDCRLLTSINGILNLTTGVDYLCYRCYALATLPTINIADSVTTATYIFASADALSYDSVSNVISKCKKVSNFSSAFRMKQFENGQTISLNTLFGNNESQTLDLTHILSQYNGSSEFQTISNSVVLTGKIPSNVTSTSWMCYGLTATIPYDLLSNATSLTTANTMFAYSNITFVGDGRPQQIDKYEQSVTLSNAISKNFLCNSLVNISQMFFNSNIITNDTTLFANLSNLVNTNSTFGSSSVKAYSFRNSNNETELIDLNVTNMWVNNPKIENISGCFANIYTVYCTNLYFNDLLKSSNTVNISGLFGLNAGDYKSYRQIYIDLDSIVPNIITDRQYAIPSNGSYNGPGVFQNRCVHITTILTNGQLLSKLNNICRYMFCNATLYLPSSTTTFNLTRVLTSCQGMFQGCRLYSDSSDLNHTYTINDRKFVDVILPSNCGTYTSMFQDSSVLNSLPQINSSNASDLSSMYRGCVIKTPGLEIPSNYFQVCSNSLSNVSYMFYNNMFLTSLQYNSNRGLFEGCVNLSNVNYMFFGASFLHMGIPNNLFGVTELPRLTSLSYMFGDTSVLYDVEDNSHKWFNSNTIEPLVNLENISGLFYRIKINSSMNAFTAQGYSNTLKQSVMDADTERAVIDPSTFSEKTFTNITKLFEHTVINPPTSLGMFRFMGFTIGTDAFFSSSISNIDENFVDNNYISSIANVNRMFYQSNTGSLKGGIINNLSTFINELIKYPNISKSNIAGNINDELIPETYKNYTTEGDGILYYGHGLQLTTDPESDWSNYKRYVY